MAVVKPQTPGLIDTISAGYVALNRRLWVVMIPIVLDLYLWLGTRLSLAPLIRSLSDQVASALVQVSPDIAQPATLVQNLQQADLRVLLAWINFVPLLLPEFLLPPVGKQAALPEAAVVPVTNWWVVIGAVLLINLVTLLVSSLFLSLLAGAVAGAGDHRLPHLRRMFNIARRIGSFLLVLIGAGLLLGMPFLVFTALVVSLIPGTLLPAAFAWAIALFWVWVYTSFGIEAILMSDVGPLRAIYNSVHIVRHNLLSALALLLLSMVIVSGLAVIWRALATTHLGMVVAISGSAYVQSGLIAARLVFYRDRLQRWQGAGSPVSVA